MRPLGRLLISLELASKYLLHYHNELVKLKDDMPIESIRAISCKSAMTLARNAGREVHKKIDKGEDARLGRVIQRIADNSVPLTLPQVLALVILELENAIRIVTEAPRGVYDRNITFRLRMAYGQVSKAASQPRTEDHCFVDTEEAEFAINHWERLWKQIA